MTPRDRPHVFTIAPGAPFLETLARKLIDGSIIDGFLPGGDPLALAKATIYVPTRRASRELRAVFARLSSGKTAILPTIRPLGEFDEDLANFDADPSGLDRPEPINAERRVLELAQLVRAWAKAIPRETRQLFGEDPLVIPANAADAVWLARDLASLMDDAEREGGDWSRLKELVPDDMSAWWQLTLEFMTIVSEQWPQHLAGCGLADPAAHRNAILRAEAARLAAGKASGPVIAAGSTGSLPATAELLSVIARLPRGAVVLPGLDRDMADEPWSMLDQGAETPSALGHPQFGLKKLIGMIGIERREVVELGEPEPGLVLRGQTIADALMPAEATHLWMPEHKRLESGLDAVCEINAASEMAEALAIATVLRESVENGQTPAALVTADRTLGRRVSAELERFGIKADDSGGTPLDQSPPATLFGLLLETTFGPANPAVFLSLLKHPLASFGMERATARRAVEVLELIALRGAVLDMNVQSILDHIRKPLDRAPDSRSRDNLLKRFSAAEIENALDIGIRFGEAVQPLLALKNSDETGVQEACRISVKAFEHIGSDADGGLSRLYAGESGEQFADLLRSLTGCEAAYRFAPGEWPSIFRALASDKSVKPRFGSDPRVFIWGALEARLQTVETLVLGGLNEKSWPQRPSDDPFLSRTMKGGIGIEPPERRIGLAAHDFQMLMGARRVVLTRASRSEGAPTVPSRWLQRLHAVIGADGAKALAGRGERFVTFARAIDKGTPSPRARQPEPKPPVALRPTHFSVTEIELLRRDPYAIFAKRILGLTPLDPLIREADARERGTLFHAILEDFARKRGALPGSLDLMMEIGRRRFEEAKLPPETEAVWWRRFEKTALSFVACEAERAALTQSTHVEETSGKIAVGGTRATLSGRADRIDLLNDGTAAIIDYKTGNEPSVKVAYSLINPQLPLEAALLARGGFLNGRKLEAGELAYVRLRPKGEVEWQAIRKPARYRPDAPALNASELGAKAWDRLRKLLLFYDNEQTGYRSRALPVSDTDFEGDYDHLARVLEWSAGGDSDDGGAAE